MTTTYSTTNDVEQRLSAGELAALTKSTPYDCDEVTRQRQRGYAIIRGKIGARYDLAADLSGNTELADLLRELELDLVEYSLWGNRREDVPKRTQKRYDDAMKLLDQIAGGSFVPPGLTAATARVDNQAVVVGPERAFTREDMKGMF